jgi:hypothetical protein
VQRDDPGNRYGFDMVLPPHKQNMGELHNLCVRRGTLTEEDRFRINEHIVQTYIMLKTLPWPRRCARCPSWRPATTSAWTARLPAPPGGRAPGPARPGDGTGRRVRGADRGRPPLQAAKPLSETLTIMARMCAEQHLDAGLFRYFLRGPLWQRFAHTYLRPEQIDAVDLDQLEALLAPRPAAQPERPPNKGQSVG